MHLLIDNRVSTDAPTLAEPAFCALLETEGRRILFDAGQSDVLLRNADTLGQSLTDLDDIALSHGHLDHTWGLVPLIRRWTDTLAMERPLKRPRLLAHPAALQPKRSGEIPIGTLLTANVLSQYMDLTLTPDPVWLTDRLVWLGEIPRTNGIEARKPLGERLVNDSWEPDLLADDTSLAYIGDEGLVIISGCAHAGIINTVRHAQSITEVARVDTVIGGTHLHSATDALLAWTRSALQAIAPRELYACHCTGQHGQIGLSDGLPLRTAGAGLRLSWT